MDDGTESSHVELYVGGHDRRLRFAVPLKAYGV